MLQTLARWTGLDGKTAPTPTKPMRVPSVLVNPSHVDGASSSSDIEDQESNEQSVQQSTKHIDGYQAHPNRAKHKLTFVNDHKAMQSVIAEFGIIDKLPFIETLSHTINTSMEALGVTDVEDALTREAAFAKQALLTVEACKPKIIAAGVPFTRPADFFAEMVKDDAHMARIRQRMLDEKSSIEASQKARQLRELKKLGKQIQIQKTKERASEKRNMNERVADLKKKSRSALERRIDDAEADNADAEDFDVNVEETLGFRGREESDGKRGEKRGMSRTARNSRFGFAKKSKQNDRKSHEAFDKMGPGSKTRGHGKGRPNRGAKRLGKSRRK